MAPILRKKRLIRNDESSFSDGYGKVTNEDRKWEKQYGQRWQHDKMVRSTHGVNCTGSCSWKIYVRNGLVLWETQQTNYPETRPDLPNHEPRGCARGASYSWYLYSAQRIKYPLIRRRLIELWRNAKKIHLDPVNAWESIVENAHLSNFYKQIRGLGGFIRSNWDEVNEIIAASNVYTAKRYGPDRIIGFSPIPAMSMVSYAAGSRYLSLIGGVALSFYDWYCDLPPASPQTWGEQTDVPESADWYNSSFIIVWGSNVPLTRTPDAHFLTEVRYKGAKTVVISPDFSEAARFGDIWIHPQQGTDTAVGLAMGHVIFKEFHLDKKCEYFHEYCRKYSDMPFLVKLEKDGDKFIPKTLVRASEFKGNLGVTKHPEWKPVVFDEKTKNISVPQGSIGSRWSNEGKWNLENRDERDGATIDPLLSLIDIRDDVLPVAFPYFGNLKHELKAFVSTEHKSILIQNVPVCKILLAEGEAYVTTVYDLTAANYGIDRGLGGSDVAASYDDDAPYTPAWQEKITGVKREYILSIARQFAENAEKTKGRSMVILGAGINHWYNSDMTYRSIINMLIMCGCIGQSGGGWAHYVGQEKLRPQTGWLPIAFGLDWSRPPRQMNSTSFFYAHTNQWRYETLNVNEHLSPLADKKKWEKTTPIDCNVRAERMGWLPSAPQLEDNPLQLCKDAAAAGKDPKDYIVEKLKNGDLHFSCEDPDNPKNFPRNLFVWRSNLLGSSSKGHEYFLKHLLGTQNGEQASELKEGSENRPSEVRWHEKAPEGKLDLLVTLDFRMSTTCIYSDIVLPTATWYEKNDLSTTDMHPFIHPLTLAVNPMWEARSDWDIFKALAKKFSELSVGHLGVEKDAVTVPILHDTPGEIAQPDGVKDWKRGECEPIMGKTMPNIVIVERDYPNVYKKFTALGPSLSKLGNGSKGTTWSVEDEVEFLKKLNYKVREEGVSCGCSQLNTDVQVIESILTLAPETNGNVAVKAWKELEKTTGRKHVHLGEGRSHEQIRFRDLQAQPRKIISSPTWSGLESDEVSYTAGYTNMHELIPWRTLTGRQHFYQDHQWMRDFGESLCVYKPPINTRTLSIALDKYKQGKKSIVLNFIHAHQKWGIHSTFSDNLLMLTLGRGGPIIWISETDAKSIGIEDNDWIEAYNINGSLVARAVVSQRVPIGMSLMYHAQEKMVNVPGSQISMQRGGIHNSITRISPKPTHMIGGYAQLSYGFNYYGTVGCNRDEFVIIQKLDKIDWMEEREENK